ncbi:UPF0103-domain-containing protein [Pluteus cervinus]|uniref:UPF0103-domain-containing protein n=1 Tax=Pluteus cervinus TaxID=181527 RepID=A0ACD3BGP2_9AGAR|nr:UPF0103-domain-containing protein [Pluteus cervinus]
MSSSRTTNRKTKRAASHAGDWYTGDAPTLDAELTKWLGDVDATSESLPIRGCKAIIAPHAGYSYSGPTAAWAYKSIDTSGVKRVFILGPSHHIYLDGCALSTCQEYETPIGSLPLDLDVIKELRATGKFEDLTAKADEDEHSIEMHLPYVRKIFQDRDIKVVPVVVGAISHSAEATYGAILAPHLASEETLFVVSSDFCHWGTRFSYTFYYPEPLPSETPAVRLSRSVAPTAANPIHQSIRQLDHQGMNVLTLDPETASNAHAAFSEYLSTTKNTICGRHPIGVLLGALAALESEKEIHPTLKWVRYEQSSACSTVRDSSVSYASAWVKF